MNHNSKATDDNYPGRAQKPQQVQGKALSIMNEQYAEIIKEFPLFRGFTLHGAKLLLECGEVKEYSPGEVVLKEGDNPTFVLLVLTGKMQVFIERQGRDLVLTDAAPGTILGELAVLCGMPRSASVRALEGSAVLQWSATDFRDLLLRDVFLSERIFRESLRTLIEKERSLIDSLSRAQAGRNPGG
jgi:CRP/FNR family cyclic AMP-dependent transcriptional regulator